MKTFSIKLSVFFFLCINSLFAGTHQLPQFEYNFSFSDKVGDLNSIVNYCAQFKERNPLSFKQDRAVCFEKGVLSLIDHASYINDRDVFFLKEAIVQCVDSSLDARRMKCYQAHIDALLDGDDYGIVLDKVIAIMKAHVSTVTNSIMVANADYKELFTAKEKRENKYVFHYQLRSEMVSYGCDFARYDEPMQLKCYNDGFSDLKRLVPLHTFAVNTCRRVPANNRIQCLSTAISQIMKRVSSNDANKYRNGFLQCDVNIDARSLIHHGLFSNLRSHDRKKVKCLEDYLLD